LSCTGQMLDTFHHLLSYYFLSTILCWVVSLGCYAYRHNRWRNFNFLKQPICMVFSCCLPAVSKKEWVRFNCLTTQSSLHTGETSVHKRRNEVLELKSMFLCQHGAGCLKSWYVLSWSRYFFPTNETWKFITPFLKTYHLTLSYFIYGLTTDTVSCSDCTAPGGRRISE
jgi:hypothetical protein